jgi:hypothetical protein
MAIYAISVSVIASKMDLRNPDSVGTGLCSTTSCTRGDTGDIDVIDPRREFAIEGDLSMTTKGFTVRMSMSTLPRRDKTGHGIESADEGRCCSLSVSLTVNRGRSRSILWAGL